MPDAPSTKIYGIWGREILDSRGNPTVETTVILESGYRGTAAVPSGASVGIHEALELRDGDKNRYNGLGTLKSSAIVNSFLGQKLRSLDASDQKKLDQTMIELDATENKSRLGANSILSVSMAAAVAVASSRQMPLYRYLNTLVKRETPIVKIPTPMFNIINGGKHSGWNLDFQEFHIIPASNKPFHEALRTGADIYHSLGSLLTTRGSAISVGDEGGYAPNLFTNLDALEVISQAVRHTGHQLNMDVFFGIDFAASSFRKDHGYQIKDRPTEYTPNDFLTYLKELYEKYRIILMEDAFAEDEWGSWTNLTKTLGPQCLIVGDDLIVSNIKRLEKAISEHAVTAIVLKPNQIGTITELLDTLELARSHDIKTIMSHRSGETNDSFIADLAVGLQTDYVKFGAPCRGERIAKYNRLLAIEGELAALAQQTKPS
jgi:enolase